MSYSRKKRLGEVLRAGGKISNEDLSRAIDEQQGKLVHLGELLFKRGLMDKQDLARAIAEVTRIEYVDSSSDPPERDIIDLLPLALAGKCCALPWRREGMKLVVVMAQPQDLNQIQQLRFATGLEISPRFGFREEIVAAIGRAYGVPDVPSAAPESVSPPKAEGSASQQIEFVSTSTRMNNREAIEAVQAELTQRRTPAVRLVTEIILAAVEREASDIHIEPQALQLTVRIRVDGVLRDLRSIPRALQNSLISRIKILSDMDIADRRAPQDGRFLVKLAARQLDMRVSSLPTQYGEKIVMRLLESDAPMRTLQELGLESNTEQRFMKLLNMPQGTILVTGPTGSGKSTTLYAALNVLRNSAVNIVTVEDPVEYVLPGVNQVHVNSKAGLTFASCLRSILRQDPNIIMVGEIRDRETAEICMKAAQTGHLVLTTLHTNDSISAIVRLLDLDVPAYLIASSVSGILAQRLARRLCTCHKRVPADDAYIAQMRLAGADRVPEWRNITVGCADCDRTGFKGRVGIYELLVFDEGVRNIIRTNARSNEILDWVRNQGMRLMQEDGLDRVLEGVTTLEEIQRIISFETLGPSECPTCKRALTSEFRFCPSCGEKNLVVKNSAGVKDSQSLEVATRR